MKKLSDGVLYELSVSQYLADLGYRRYYGYLRYCSYYAVLMIGVWIGSNLS